jgi:hypothetical protein
MGIRSPVARSFTEDWIMIRKTYVAVVALGISMFGTGCGAVSSLTNPGVLWAIGEPAPMGVVVRRAEVASATADQVDRLIAETPLDEAAKEASFMTADDAKTRLTAIGGEAVYQGTQGVRVVPAEAWLDKLAAICPSGEAKTAIAFLGEDTAADYKKVAETGRDIAALEMKIKLAENEKDKPGADAAKFDSEIAGYEAEIDKLEEAFDPLVDALIEKIKTKSAGLSAEDKKIVGPFIGNLRAAVSDALTANQAATLRYPMATTGMSDDIQKSAARFAADSVEDQIGTRPDMAGLSPDVKLDGTDVKLTINNVPADKIGDIKVDQLVADTTEKTTVYFGRALGLLGYAEGTSSRLRLQGKILEAWVEGLGAGEQGVADISSLEVLAAPGAKGESKGASKAKRTAGGLKVPECGAAPAAAKPEGDAAAAEGEKKPEGDAAKPEEKKEEPKKEEPKK